jgi:hypothetical protein
MSEVADGVNLMWLMVSVALCLHNMTDYKLA